jgi:hypothetical protein
MRISIATCRELPEPDPDAEALLQTLRSRGWAAEACPWEDGAPVGDVVLVRSTWNYVQHLSPFLDWVAAVSDRLINPAPVIRWNVHKSYLLDLAAAGIPIVPTRLLRRGDRPELPWPEVVAKPAVGAASFETRRLAGAPDAWLHDAVRTRDMLVQPYIRDVETSGERSIVWLGGEVSHAVRKRPRFAGEDESVDSVPIADDEAALAHACMAYAGQFGAMTYGRVDVIRDGATLRVMELELIEPSLFLAQHPPSFARLADALARHAR